MAKRDRSERDVEYRGTGLYLSLAVVLVLVLAVLALALQNTDSVDFEFLWWDLEVPLFGLIVGGGLLAVVIDELIGLAWRRARRRRLAERRELSRLRREAETRRTEGEDGEAPAAAGEDAHPSEDTGA
jgi:uncharacterized integral membrane protein